MLLSIILVISSLALILFSCFIFTNAIEWFGKKLKLGEGIVGSVLAAVGTALPEIIIPIIAILFEGDQKSNEIGIGAILGAPFMLSTLAFFVTGASIVIYALLGKRPFKVNADIMVLSRDLEFFIVLYGIAVLSSFVYCYTQIKAIIAIILLLSYIYYVRRSLSTKTNQLSKLDTLYITRAINIKENLFLIVVQLLLSLMGIMLGAHLFVKNIENISILLDISPLVLSIIITPIATELPEKLNSVIWTGKNRDTLAMGNITGAMVFQSCFPVAFGMLCTPWNLSGITVISAILALSSAILNLGWIKIFKTASPILLMLSGSLYIIFILCL